MVPGRRHLPRVSLSSLWGLGAQQGRQTKGRWEAAGGGAPQCTHRPLCRGGTDIPCRLKGGFLLPVWEADEGASAPHPTAASPWLERKGPDS